jgi:hypothetical protein
VLSALAAVLHPSELDALVALVLTNLEKQLSGITEAIDRHDYAGTTTHDLIAAAGKIGAPDLSTAAQALDDAARAGQDEAVQSAADHLKDVAESTKAALRAWLAAHHPPASAGGA